MNNNFDLSPAIGLLHALSPECPLEEVSSPPSSSSSASSKEVGPETSKSDLQSRTLGDFSALWSFLGSPEPEDERKPAYDPAFATTVAENATGCGGGEDHKDFLLPSSKGGNPPNGMKPKRRHVTFSHPNALLPSCLPPKKSKLEDLYPDITLDHHAPRNKNRKGVESFTKTVPKVATACKSYEPRTNRPVTKSERSSYERKAMLIQKIVLFFPQSATALLDNRNIPKGTPNLPADSSDIHVFIDNSNIVVGFSELIKKKLEVNEKGRIRQPRFSFHSFSLLLERGRSVAKRVLVGSSPLSPVHLEARSLGYDVQILERVLKDRPHNKSSASSGSDTTGNKTYRGKFEQAVDEVLHLKMLESLLDFKPSTIILASGDAAKGEYSPGFFRAVERFLEKGWKVEIYSWKKCASGAYRQKGFCGRWKGKFRLVVLDPFVEDLLE